MIKLYTMIKFDAGYSRTGYIKVEKEYCHCCRNKKIFISIDSSEDEYKAGCICLNCTKKLIDSYKAL